MEESMINDTVAITYNNNMQFLQRNHRALYDKLVLLETAISRGLYQEKYALEYTQGYFDLYVHQQEGFLYGQDSTCYSQSIADSLTFDMTSDNIKPYRHYTFEDTLAQQYEKADIMYHPLIGLSPISHYTDTHLPDQYDTAIHKFVCFGTGLGLHLPLIHEKFGCDVYLICEKDLELFRLSLFTVAYDQIAHGSTLLFSIADDQDQFEQQCSNFLSYRFVLNYNIKFNLFYDECASMVIQFKNKVMQQNFITYDYQRRYMSNVRPIEYIKKNKSFLNVCYDVKRQSPLNQYPVLLLASGPSIAKNIEWLKRNHERFFVMTVSANLHLLYEEKIKPDLIMHIDEDEERNLADFSRVDMSFFKDTIVVLSSITHPNVQALFDDNPHFIIQAIGSHHYNQGRLFSVSVGEILYAFSLLYDAKDIYLLGLDFALDPDTNQSHFGDHIDKQTHDDVKEDYTKTVISLDNDYVYIKGNFRDQVCTTARLQISIPRFNYYSRMLHKEDTMVYNLSDGAYLDKTAPLQIEKLQEETLPLLDKNEVGQVLYTLFEEHSKRELDGEDIKILKQKLKRSKNIKKRIKEQKTKTYKEAPPFLKDFESLIMDIIQGEGRYKSEELNEILVEYTRLTSHYIYNFCEQKEIIENDVSHLNRLNEIFTSQLLKIVQKYSDVVKTIV